MLTEEAKIILENVAVHILEEPNRLNMDNWCTREWHAGDKQRDGYSKKINEYSFASCGTAACIAGWVVLLKDGMEQAYPEKRVSDIASRAREILGLEDFFGGLDLFFADKWDAPFKDAYADADTVESKAQVAANFIRHYIETRG